MNPPTDPPASRRGTVVRQRRWAMCSAVLAVCSVLTGCGAPDAAAPNSPGTNLTVNDVKIRYAHLEAVPDGQDGWQAGDDVPLYLWAVNEGSSPAAIRSVSSPLATSVMHAGGLPVELAPARLVKMGSNNEHFILKGIRRQVRGAQLIPVELTFADGMRVTFDVEAIGEPNASD